MTVDLDVLPTVPKRRSSKRPERESKGIGNNRHMRAKPPTNSLPNILRSKSVRTRWQGLFPSSRALVYRLVPQRPQGIEARQSDFSYDGMKAWLRTRQSFV
jgi:hypothetical protein